MNNLSMFDEFEQTIDLHKKLLEKYGDKACEHILPAMIILERKITGENKHAIIGQPLDNFILFEWGLSHMIEGYDMDFKTALNLLEEIHKNIKSFNFENYKGEM